MNGRIYNVLFLRTGNSARSILAEAPIEHWGQGRFKVYSAGSFPRGRVNPLAIDLMASLHLPTQRLRSKSGNEFARPGAPVMDFVFTVCDQAAGEVCRSGRETRLPRIGASPIRRAVEGTEITRRNAFRDAFRALENRIKLFTSLPLDKLDRMAIKREVDQIGRSNTK